MHNEEDLTLKLIMIREELITSFTQGCNILDIILSIIEDLIILTIKTKP